VSFYDLQARYKDVSDEELFSAVTPADAARAVETQQGDAHQLRALLSPPAEAQLEAMAREAHRLTLWHFGRTVQLYTPLYLSNYCDNQCAYCGFNAAHDLPRRRLTLEEVEKEAAAISSTGLGHILVLTGESREKSSLRYITDCVGVLRKYFSSIAVEIYALTKSEYAGLVHAGVDALTLYQETYDEGLYDRVHAAGPKKEYRFRLDAPERGAQSGMRSVHIGALLGLRDWRREAFFLGLHAKYLQDAYSGVEIGISVPRLRPHAGGFQPACVVSDRAIAQIIIALRIFLPRLAVSISTRESPQLREDLLPLGITRMSAGSSTRVGGHTMQPGDPFNLPQFEIADERTVQEIKVMLAVKGYQPVMKDWMHL
jgi:2-iminoacetate synthase